MHVITPKMTGHTKQPQTVTALTLNQNTKSNHTPIHNSQHTPMAGSVQNWEELLSPEMGGDGSSRN